ncbi:MAG: hypothetical protein IT461_04525 [Planctomycetes bacterium]|nr:hypothetical protein [Planctomycetota bacterium]
MSKLLVASLVCAVTLGLIIGWVLLNRPPHESPALASSVNAEEPPKETWRDRVLSPMEGKTPAQIADKEFNNLSDAKQRRELLDWVANQPWVDHKTPVLRKALVADQNEDVQLVALSKCVKLAEKSGTSAVDEVIRAGLSAANPKVVQQSLREARKHPSVDLVPDLLEVADSSASHRFLAIDALAFTDDLRARAKVIEFALREDGEKTERIRAIALLVKIKDVRADEVLAQLCGSADHEIKAVAVETMAARDKK